MGIGILITQFQKAGVLDIVASHVEVYNPWRAACGYMPEAQFVLKSDKIVTPYGTLPGFGKYCSGR